MNEINRIIEKYSEDYRGLPFWSWNSRLEIPVLENQIQEMKNAGLGGFFMHARAGLETGYLSRDWFECISACIKKAKYLDMKAWAYDEEGWPSGFAGGKVTEIGYEHHMKWLEFSEDLIVENDSVKLLKVEETLNKFHYVYIYSNSYYIDVLSTATVKEFLRITHQEYFNRFGNEFGKTMPGFFTDEPQYAIGKFPFTSELEMIFKNIYGYSLYENIFALEYDTTCCEKVRFDYWSLISRLYRESFGKQIFEWCDEHNCKLTGHVMAEDNLSSQMAATAGAMAFYEYMHIPGIDWLGRSISNSTIPKQAGSAALQLGKKQVLTETFGLCGWNVSFEDLKWITEWQFVNGVNIVCAHLQSYSLQGLRKRDYPPSLFIQQSWWDKYKLFNDYFSKLGALLSQSTDMTSVLLIHPITSMYLAYPHDNLKVQKLENCFAEILENLSSLNINYHLGDESLMSSHGSVDKGMLIIGEINYTVVVLPYLINITSSTYRLLKSFGDKGGRILTVFDPPLFIDGMPSDDLQTLNEFIIRYDNQDDMAKAIRSLLPAKLDIKENNNSRTTILSTQKIADDKRIIFLVNSDKDNPHEISVDTGLVDNNFETLDLTTMARKPLISNAGVFTLLFMPAQSYVILETICPDIVKINPSMNIFLENNFTLESMTLNSLTLDICDYQIDDGQWISSTPVILLQKTLLEMRRSFLIKMRFHVDIEHCPDNLYLAVECPDQKTIFINDKQVEFIKANVHFVDNSFVTANIIQHLRPGSNTILIEQRFFQNQKVYDVLFGENMHGTEINKLTFDTELESIYLVGDFGVTSLSGYENLPREAIRTPGYFIITSLPAEFTSGDFTQQGLCFFAGTLKISQNIKINKFPGYNHILKINKPNAPVCDLYINKVFVRSLVWAPYDTDITDFISDGDNLVEIVLYASNRNLLGPHHYIGGESYNVAPSTFTGQGGWAEGHNDSIWTDDYCFVKFGISC